MPPTAVTGLDSRTGTRLPITLPITVIGGCIVALTLGATLARDGVAGSGEAARRALERMSWAAQHLNYDGDFVYRSADSLETMAMRIVHRGGPDGERERLVALNGVACEVLRDGDKVTWYRPDDREVWQSKSSPRPLTLARAFEGNGGPGPAYRLSTRPGGRVAGRHTDQVEVRPADEYRYGYRLWLDREMGLLLKSELVDEHGDALEVIVYTRIEVLDSIPDSLLEPENTAQGYTWYRSGDQARGSGAPVEPDWTMWLPAGFEPRVDAGDTSAESQGEGEHLVFSDGLASVSVFIEERRGAEDRHLTGLDRMGAVNAFGITVDGAQITVVGEVPAATVEKIARSVARR